MTTSAQAAPRQLPSSVLVSAILTWLFAAPTGLVVAFFGTVGVPILEAFSGEARTEIVALFVLTVALCVAACVAALCLLLRHAGARWTLIGLSAVSVAGSLVGAMLLLPLVITVASVTVIVLLMREDARDWFR